MPCFPLVVRGAQQQPVALLLIDDPVNGSENLWSVWFRALWLVFGCEDRQHR